MKNSRGFIQIVIILLALVLVAAGAYYFGTKNKSVQAPTASVQPSANPVATADPTVNWKTYTNKKYGYKFQYPENWAISEKLVSDPDPKTGIAKHQQR